MTKMEMRTYSDDQQYDICSPENEWLLPQIKNRGPLGSFIIKLREKALAGGKPLHVSGLSSVPTIIYDGETVSFVPGFSHDPEGMAPSYSTYTMRPMDYKKPWVQAVLQESGESFVQAGRLNAKDLFEEVLEEKIDTDVLKKKYPDQGDGPLFEKFADAVSSNLGDIFRLANSPVSYVGPELEFVDTSMRAKYLANDPTTMEEVKAGLILAKNQLGI